VQARSTHPRQAWSLHTFTKKAVGAIREARSEANVFFPERVGLFPCDIIVLNEEGNTSDACMATTLTSQGSAGPWFERRT
jgi:hypothetical protein